MNAWLVIVAAGLGSYLFRISMVVLADRVTMPERLERASTFVAPAAFAALAAGGFAANTAGVDVAGWTAPLAAVVIAVGRRSPHGPPVRRPARRDADVVDPQRGGAGLMSTSNSRSPPSGRFREGHRPNVRPVRTPLPRKGPK